MAINLISGNVSEKEELIYYRYTIYMDIICTWQWWLMKKRTYKKALQEWKTWLPNDSGEDRSNVTGGGSTRSC